MTPIMHVPEESIKSYLEMDNVIGLMEYVFENPDLGDMPSKIYLELGENDFRAMPARFESAVGIKWAALFPENRINGYGDSVSATIMLNDSNSGHPIAIMDGMLITSYRTAAVTGLATKYLSRTNSRIAAFIGCGFQTKFQIEAILNVRTINTLKLFDLDVSRCYDLIDQLDTKCEYIICEDLEECVRGSDIVTTLTPSREPFVMSNWLEPGMHLNAIGADAEGKQEFEDDVVDVCSSFVVDDKAQAFHSGESQHSKNKDPMVDLFDMVESKDSRGVNGATGAKREAEHKGISFFDSTGLAIEDIALAALVYTNYMYSILNQTQQDEK